MGFQPRGQTQQFAKNSRDCQKCATLERSRFVGVSSNTGCLVSARASRSIRDILEMFLFGVEALSKRVESASKRIEAVSGRCFCGVLRRYDLFKSRYGAVILCYEATYAVSGPACGANRTDSVTIRAPNGRFRYALGKRWVRFGPALGQLRVCFGSNFRSSPSVLQVCS